MDIEAINDIRIPAVGMPTRACHAPASASQEVQTGQQQYQLSIQKAS